MKTRNVVGLVILVSALAFVTQQAVSQTAKEPLKDKAAAPENKMPGMSEQEAAMMQEWMKLAAPSDAHKKLEPLVGKWNHTSKVWMSGPGSTPMESSGTTERKWILGGRFLMEEHKGQMMGMPHEGLGLNGYDNFRNMYTSTWCDNMGTTILTMKGMADPAGKTFTFYGEMDEPGMKVTGRTVKYVTRIIDNDKNVFEIIDLHAGDNYKVVEVTYTRVK